MYKIDGHHYDTDTMSSFEARYEASETQENTIQLYVRSMMKVDEEEWRRRQWLQQWRRRLILQSPPWNSIALYFSNSASISTLNLLTIRIGCNFQANLPIHRLDWNCQSKLPIYLYHNSIPIQSYWMLYFYAPDAVFNKIRGFKSHDLSVLGIRWWFRHICSFILGTLYIFLVHILTFFS